MAETGARMYIQQKPQKQRYVDETPRYTDAEI